jgi:hypothetical protein
MDPLILSFTSNIFLDTSLTIKPHELKHLCIFTFLK